MIRLIATDLDGTLLGQDGRIGADDLSALHEAHAEGVHLVIATGRPARWLDCLHPLVDLEPTVIVSNGAAQVDLASGTVLRSSTIPTDDVRAIGADLRAAFPDVLLALEQGVWFGCEPGWLERTNASMVPEDVSGPALGIGWEDLLAQIHPVVKILALGVDRDAETFALEATAVVRGRAEVTHSAVSDHAAMLEISAPGVSKASALADLCATLGVTPAQVAAFGDMPNDLDMLAFAGHGFAMGNAHDSLRQRFPVIGTNIQGGVGATVRGLLDQA